MGGERASAKEAAKSAQLRLGTFAPMIVRLLTALVSVLVLSARALAQAPPAPPQTPAAPASRLETEYKLAVPAGQDGEVWRWLTTRYAADKTGRLGAGWTSSLGDETFRDRYFDVPAATLLRARAGLRHRQRFDTTGQLTKQLVQLKLTDDAGGLLREEIKFKPVEGATDRLALPDLLRPADRAALDSILTTLGVRFAAVRPAFSLHQRRRRLYFQQDGEAFSTVTLDSSYAGDGRPATFTEIEIELNEKRYTGAAEPERARMRAVLDGIRADVLRQFPRLTQDQRPKYTKLAALLAADSGTATGGTRPTTAAPPATPPTTPPRAVPMAVAGAAVGLFVGWWWLWRRRRRRRRARV